jgi:hypothetical protein
MIHVERERDRKHDRRQETTGHINTSSAPELAGRQFEVNLTCEPNTALTDQKTGQSQRPRNKLHHSVPNARSAAALVLNEREAEPCFREIKSLEIETWELAAAGSDGLEGKKLKTDIEGLKREVAKLKCRCADINHERDGTVPLMRSSRQRSQVIATSETSTEPVSCLLTEYSHEGQALVKNFKTELKSWLQSFEVPTNLCDESKFRVVKTAMLSEGLTSSLLQVTELRRSNLAQSVIQAICAEYVSSHILVTSL